MVMIVHNPPVHCINTMASSVIPVSLGGDGVREGRSSALSLHFLAIESDDHRHGSFFPTRVHNPRISTLNG